MSKKDFRDFGDSGGIPHITSDRGFVATPSSSEQGSAKHEPWVNTLAYTRSLDDFPGTGKDGRVVPSRCVRFLEPFEGKTIQVTVLSVDMVRSTQKVMTIPMESTGRFYQKFIESTSELVEDYGGYFLKNAGDCIIGFFPYEVGDTASHSSAVSCGLATRDAVKDSLSPYYLERRMPSISCRVSADFGKVNVVRLSCGTDHCTLDLFGDVMNSVAKILHHAKPNQMVIGDNLLNQLSRVHGFHFKLLNGLPFRDEYQVWRVEGRKL